MLNCCHVVVFVLKWSYRSKKSEHAVIGCSLFKLGNGKNVQSGKNFDLFSGFHFVNETIFQSTQFGQSAQTADAGISRIGCFL